MLLLLFRAERIAAMTGKSYRCATCWEVLAKDISIHTIRVCLSRGGWILSFHLYMCKHTASHDTYCKSQITN